MIKFITPDSYIGLGLACYLLAGCAAAATPAAESPSLTIVMDEQVGSDVADQLLPAFSLRATQLGCGVASSREGPTFIVGVSCDSRFISMARREGRLLIACNKETSTAECKDLFRQIIGDPKEGVQDQSKVELIGTWNSEDPTIMPQVRKSWLDAGCKDVSSGAELILMDCAGTGLALFSKEETFMLGCLGHGCAKRIKTLMSKTAGN